GRHREKRRLSSKTLFHDPDSNEPFAGAAEQVCEAVGEPAGRPAACVTSCSAVSIPHFFHVIWMGTYVATALLLAFTSYTKAHT
ncbi:hypothetical protein STEG23_022215, partial [Scotinomys teguina]